MFQNFEHLMYIITMCSHCLEEEEQPFKQPIKHLYGKYLLATCMFLFYLAWYGMVYIHCTMVASRLSIFSVTLAPKCDKKPCNYKGSTILLGGLIIYRWEVLISLVNLTCIGGLLMINYSKLFPHIFFDPVKF